MSDRPDDFRRQIGTLWRTAMVGLDTVRDVVVRSSQTGRLRVDIALLHNERAQLLQDMGDRLVRIVDENGFDESTEPFHALYDKLKDVEGRIRSDSARAVDNAFGAPRGFEAEAAADYGDAGAGEDSVDVPVSAPKRARRATRGKGGAHGGNKKNHR